VVSQTETEFVFVVQKCVRSTFLYYKYKFVVFVFRSPIIFGHENLRLDGRWKGTFITNKRQND
jgi:hypothetical protein